jgi:hypothetical protein
MPERELGVGQGLPTGKEKIGRGLVTEEALVNVLQVSAQMIVLLPHRPQPARLPAFSAV